MFSPNEDRETWDRILTLDRSSIGEICGLWFHVEKKVARLQAALKNPAERAAALRLLLFFQDDEQRKAVFSELVELAAWGHSDIGLCRTAIKSIPLDWVRTNIIPAISSVLKSLGDQPEVEEEAYQRFAELLSELDQTLLLKHLKTAVVHGNEGVREIGHTFNGEPNP